MFLNLVRGNRLSSYMGLEMAEGFVYKFAPLYTYIEIPARSFILDRELVAEVKRNQHVWVNPACEINVRGNYTVEVEPNPALAEFGQVQAGYRIHPGTGHKEPGFWFTARKDVTLHQLDYAVRLYMVS